MTNDNHNVMMFVTHVGAYGPLLKIWAHVNQITDEQIEVLLQILKPRFDRGEGAISPHTILKVGTICCALHDNHYYRAKVLSIRPNYSISVHFIDYGNVELVHPSAIRLLEGSPEGLELQAMSPIACGFAVTTLAPFLNAWDPKIVDHINRLLRCRHFPAIVSAKPIRHLLKLIFIGQDFFEYVISSKMALPATPEQEQFLLRYGLDENSMLEFTTSSNMYQAPTVKSAITSVHNHNNNNNNNMGLTTPNIASLPKQIVGEPLRQPQPLYVVPTQRSTPPRTQENLPFKCRVLEMNRVHEVRVSHIDDGPARFSVQLRSCAQEMESLMRNINSHPVEPVSQPQLIGYVCLGRSTKDGRLRRAVIKSITEGATQTGVYYVDYGDCDVLSYSDIYELPTQYVNPRVLSVRFCLSGVRDLNVTPEMKQYFAKLVKDRLLSLEVQPVEDTPLIQYCSLRDGDKSVLDLLKEAFPHATLTWRPAKPLPRTTREVIYISYVEGCKKFFVHLEKDKAVLDSIQSYLVDNTKNMPSLKASNVKPGLKCLAHCIADNHWYRAEVQSVDGNYVTVHYVDYGNDESIPSNRLRSIRCEDITKHPAQAIQCMLNGFDAEPYSPDLDYKFEDLVLNKPLTMTVVDVKTSVMIVDLQDNSSTSIALLLKCETQPDTNSNQQVGSWKPTNDVNTSQNIRGRRSGFKSQRILGQPQKAKFKNLKNKREESDRWNQKTYPTPSMSLDTSFEKSSWRNTDSDASVQEQKHYNSWNSSQTEKSRDHYRNDSFSPKDTSSRIERVEMEDSRYPGRGGKGGNKGMSPIPPRSDRNGGSDIKISWTDKESSGLSKGNGNHGRGGTNGRGFAQDTGNRRDFDRSNSSRSNESENERFSKNGRSNNSYDGNRARGKFNESGDKSRESPSNQWDTASTLIAKDTLTLQIPPANITVGATKHCEIVFARSPSEFYIQLFPDNSKLDEVMTKIAEIYEHGGNVLAKGNLAVGMSCVAQYSEDYNWYRAVIQSVGVGQAEVRFVDYGNTEAVTLDKIKELQADLAKLPTQAIACKLLGASKTQWNPTELSQFNELTDLKRLEAEFVTQSNNVYEVLLRPVVDGVAQDPYINEKFCSGVNLLQVRESSRNKNQMGPVAPVASTTPVPDYASPSEKWSEAIIEPGSTEKIMVTWLYNPDDFYCQLVRNYDTFKNMMEQIQTEYAGRQPATDALEAGTPVIAFFADDGGLYRAEILQLNQAHGIKVRYVDFGNLAVVQPRQIFRVERKFLKLPRLALNCSLKNLIPPNGAKTWSGPQIQSMDEFFNVDEIVCSFHQMENGRHTVSLNFNGMDVAEKLVSTGLAAFNIPPAVATSEEIVDDAASSEEHLIRVDTNSLAGQTLRVKVSEVENVNKFHIQLPSATASEKIVDEYMANMDPEVMPKLSSREVCIGAGCLIQSAEGWKRAVVINCSKPTGYQVRLIDSGAIDEIPLDCMIALPGELAVMQKQAVECCLKSATSSAAADQQLKTLVENKEVIIHVDNVENNRLVVQLFDENGQAIVLPNQAVANDKISPLCPMPIFNSVHGVMCPHIDNAESIWLKRSAQADVDAILLDELYNYYTTAGTPLVISEGKLCAAQSADGNWYRAKIVKATETGAIVHFIDYGNTEEIPRDLLKELEPQFLKQAQLAIQTSLTVKLRGTDEEQQALLRPYLPDGKEFFASIYNIHGKWVFEMNVKPGQKLSEELQQLGHVVDDTNEPKVAEPEGLVVGGKFQVQVTHAETPTSFWIQQVKEFAIIDALQAKLQQEIVNYEPVTGVPEEKLVCAARYCMDNLWYRAEVIDADVGCITVRFIDYGNCDVIDKPAECIRHLPESMKSIKWYATKCKLSLMPIGSDEWPESVIYRFESLLPDNGMPAVIIADGNPCKVELFVGDKSISDILVEENVAVKISATEELVNELVEIEYDPRSAYVSHMNGPNEFWIQQDKNVNDLERICDRCIVADMFPPLEEIIEGQLCAALFREDTNWYRARIISHSDAGTNVLFIDYGNSSVVTEIRAIPEDLACIPPLSRKCCLALPEGVDQWSEAACKKFRELAGYGATIFLLDMIDEEETATVRLTLEGADIVETELEKLCVKKHAPTPPADEIQVAPAVQEPEQQEAADQEVFISHITCLHSFWVQRTSSIEALDRMATQLSELDDENYPIVDSVEEGMLCIALFPEDSLWYRAQVIGHGDTGTSVLYIDYGNSAVTTELRKISDSLAVMPPFAKKCELARPAGIDQWCSEADQEFQKLANDGNTVFLMDIVEEAEISIVKLTLNGEDISSTLANLCLKIPVPIVEERLSPLGEETSPNVLVSHVVSPADFWIQAESKIADLEAMAEHLKNSDSFLPLNESQEGIMCAAKFPEDELWYRAKILCHDQSATEVLYIDYGNTAVSSELKTLPEDIVTIPPLSKHCALKMPEDIDTWSQEACEKFFELVADGATMFGCSELHGEAPTYVSLTENGRDVAEILAELCAKKSHCEVNYENTQLDDSQCDSSMVAEIGTTLTNSTVDTAESLICDETTDSIEIHTYRTHECLKSAPATVELSGDDTVTRFDKSASVEEIESGFETGGEGGISQECVFEEVKSVDGSEIVEITSFEVGSGEIEPTGLDVIVEEKSSEISFETVISNDEGSLNSQSASMNNESTDVLQESIPPLEPVKKNLVEKPAELVTSSPHTPKTPLAEKLVAGVVTDHRILSLESDEVIRVEIIEPTST